MCYTVYEPCNVDIFIILSYSDIIRFSPFVKTGTEAFILGSVTIKKDVRPNEIVKVVVSDYIFFLICQ